MSEQETTEYYNFLLQMEQMEFEQELIEIVSINSDTIFPSKYTANYTAPMEVHVNVYLRSIHISS